MRPRDPPPHRVRAGPRGRRSPPARGGRPWPGGGLGARAAARAERHQGVGPPRRRRVRRVLLPGHHGDPPGDLLHRGGHPRAIRRGEVGLQVEAPARVEEVPGAGALPHRALLLLPPSPLLELAPAPHRSVGDPPGPGDQPSLGRGRGEPTQLEDLVRPEEAGRQGAGQVGQAFQGGCRLHHPPRLPARDPVAHLDEVGGIAGAFVPVPPGPLELGDGRQQSPEGPPGLGVGGVGPRQGVGGHRCGPGRLSTLHLEHRFDPTAAASCRLWRRSHFEQIPPGASGRFPRRARSHPLDGAGRIPRRAGAVPTAGADPNPTWAPQRPSERTAW